MQELIKKILKDWMTDADGAQEMSSYSFLLTTVGIHVLLAYQVLHGTPVTIVEYATAMAANAAGHGAAYLTRK